MGRGTDYPERVDLEASVETLVVLGDPHGDLEATERVLEREAGPGVRFLCVGDLVGRRDGPSCSRLAALLEDRGVLTVQGNHEAWVGPGGALLVVEPPEADPHLDARARAWVRGLPASLELFHAGWGRRVAAMVHTLREPGWPDVEARNARRLCDSLGGPDLVLVGHTHRPRFLHVPPRGDVRVQAFDFPASEVLEVPLPGSGHLVIDAGSLGYPDPREIRGEDWPRERRAAHATWARVDLVARRASLHSLRPGEGIG